MVDRLQEYNSIVNLEKSNDVYNDVFRSNGRKDKSLTKIDDLTTTSAGDDGDDDKKEGNVGVKTMMLMIIMIVDIDNQFLSRFSIIAYFRPEY